MMNPTILTASIICLLIATSPAIPADPPHPVPDTGQTKCYDDQGNEINPCPQPGEPFYGQDANYTIHPMSFTKLDANGNDLPESATQWFMVRDNVTGLIWEVKQAQDDVADYANPHDADNTYTWYDPNPETNGGDAGTESENDTLDFIDSLNNSSYGGYSDWRMPTKEELHSFIDYSKNRSAVDIFFFQNLLNKYWSSNTLVPAKAYAWYINFLDGGDSYSDKSSSYYVLSVCEGQYERPSPFSSLINNGNGTVSDINTGLIWQQQDSDAAMTWGDALDYCHNLNLAEHDDWRMPTIKELESIRDLNRYGPSIDSGIFSDTKTSGYWSSTTLNVAGGYAWNMNFINGRVLFDDKSAILRYVRAVRGGQGGSLDNLVISKTGFGAGTVKGPLTILDCGPNCEQAYPRGTLITLAATPDASSIFADWSGGGCSGTGECQFQIDGDVTITATFDLPPPPPDDPTELTVVEKGADSVHLAWNPNADTNVVYNVYRSQAENGVFYRINQNPLTMFDMSNGQIHFTDRFVQPGTAYYYKVRAFLNETPSLNYSNTVNARTSPEQDYEVIILDPARIVNIGGTVHYFISIMPKGDFQGTMTILCSGLDSGVGYEFIVDNQPAGSMLSGVTLPKMLSLQVTPGSPVVPGKYNFNLLTQNVLPGGGSDTRTHPLSLTVTPESGSGIFVEVEQTEIPKGISASIYGYINPELKYRQIQLTITPWESGTPETRNILTESSGRFEDTDWITVLETGTYDLTASWIDDFSQVIESEPFTFTITKGMPVLTCQRIGGVTPALNQDFTTLGGINPPIPSALLTLRVTDPNDSYVDMPVTANAVGYRYEKIHPFFTEKGVWSFKTYWQGNADYLGCESNLLAVPVGVDFGHGMILAGGQASQYNTLWELTKKLATGAYRDLRMSGFRDDMIWFMINSQSIDINYDDIPDPVVDDSLPSVDSVTNAIRTAFAAKLDAETPLFVFMNGPADENGYFQVLGADQKINAAQLDGALDAIQIDTGCPVVIIIESQYSGGFIPELSMSNRVILTSAGNERYRIDPSGYFSFSRLLFTKLREGSNVKAAYEYVKKQRENYGYPTPQMDDDGDGKPNLFDGALASTIHFGGMLPENRRIARSGETGLLWGLRPEIVYIKAPQVLESAHSISFQAKVRAGDAAIQNVWAVIIPPDIDMTADEMIEFPEVSMVFNPDTGCYEGVFSELTSPGVYRVVVMAEDESRQMSDPSIAYVGIGAVVHPGDVNEDEKVTLADVILSLQIVSGLDTGDQHINSKADVDKDGRIGLAEAVFGLRKTAEEP